MIQPNHPRIWLSPERLARCRQRQANNDPRWTSFKVICDSYLAPGNPYGEPSINLSLCYRITGDARYAQRAIELAKPLAQTGVYALTNAVNGVGQQSSAGYNVRLVLLILAIVYDWCDGAFSLADAALFRNALTLDTAWIWPDTNPTRTGAYAIQDPGDNFYHGFLMGSWLGHLALGDETGVQRDRNRWLNEALPYCNRYQAQGFFLEGTSYGLETLYRIWYCLDAHQTATGEALVGSASWPLRAAELLPHLTTPTLDRIVPAGDQAREITGAIADPSRIAALVATERFPLLTSSLNHWLKSTWPGQQTWVWDAWQELLWGQDVSAPAAPRDLAVRHNAGTVSRTAWQADTAALWTFCGPGRQSHQDRAQGSFLLFKGDWLAGKAGLWGGSGILRETLYHNCVRCPPFDQPEFAVAEKAIQELIGPYHDSPSVQAFEDTEDYSYTRMELAGAYAYYQWNDDPTKRIHLPLAEYSREILWLKPDRVLIFDRITATDPNQEMAWCLQTKRPLTINSSTRAYSDQALFGKSFLPEAALLSSVPVLQGPAGAPSSYRLEVRPPTRQKSTRFLQALYTDSNAIPVARLLPLVAGAAEAGLELLGTDTHDAILIAPHLLPLTFTTTAERLFVTGLVAGKTYSIAPGELAAVASGQGVCVFEGLADPGSVTLSEGAPLPPPPPELATLTVQPARVVGGQPAQVIVTLSSPAISSAPVLLDETGAGTNSNLVLSIAAGATIAAIQLPTRSGQVGTITITAKLGAVTRTATLQVVAPDPPPSVVVSGKVTGAGLDQLVTGGKYRLTPEGSTTSWQIELTRVN